MTLEEKMRTKLKEAFSPQFLTVTNTSPEHQGHRESPGTGETHFRIEITSSAFRGLTPVQRHQKVYEILKDEWKSGLHAVEIHTRIPLDS